MRALFAVTTLDPAAMAARIRLLACSIPPINSTTMSAPLAARDSASVVIKDEGMPSRTLDASRTATPVTSTGAPIRAWSSFACSVSMRTTAEPTVPPPSTATERGRGDSCSDMCTASQVAATDHDTGIAQSRRSHAPDASDRISVPSTEIGRRSRQCVGGQGVGP